MATLLLSRPTTFKRIKARPPAAKAPPVQPSNAKLQEVEDQLLAAAMANFSNLDDAIESLLSDIDALPQEDATRRANQLRHHHQVERMEDLLLQAVMCSHPNRENAVERLLGDFVGDAAIDEHDEARERADFDRKIDNDFDGLS